MAREDEDSLSYRLTGEQVPDTLRAPKEIKSSFMQNPVQIITHIETVRNNIDDAAILAEEVAFLKEETGLDSNAFGRDDSGDMQDVNYSRPKAIDISVASGLSSKV